MLSGGFRKGSGNLQYFSTEKRGQQGCSQNEKEGFQGRSNSRGCLSRTEAFSRRNDNDGALWRPVYDLAVTTSSISAAYRSSFKRVREERILRLLNYFLGRHICITFRISQNFPNIKGKWAEYAAESISLSQRRKSRCNYAEEERARADGCNNPGQRVCGQFLYRGNFQIRAANSL